MKFKKIFKGATQFAGRLIDNVLTGGAIHNAIENTKISINEKEILSSDNGKIDLPKWFSMLILTAPVWLIIALKMGWLTMEEVKFIFENINPE